MTNVLLFATITTLAACGGSKPTPTPTPEPAPATASSLTAPQCTEQGGQVVGDIGDGAIHRADYRCPQSGAPPIGHIAAEPGQPTAIEGAVCCK